MTRSTKSSMTLRVLLLLTTTSCPIITTTNNNVMVSAWSPPIITSRVTTSILSTIRHPTSTTSSSSKSMMKLHMVNNPQDQEEPNRPIAREGEWSAYLDENYGRIYYFNHESVSCDWICHCYIVSVLLVCISIQNVFQCLFGTQCTFDHYYIYY